MEQNVYFRFRLDNLWVRLYVCYKLNKMHTNLHA